MKIAVNLVIDVDPDAYRADYGEEHLTLDEIREDMRLRAVDGVNWELRHYREDWFRGARLQGEK